jgi:ABC-type enterochelin transport system permease subunit
MSNVIDGKSRCVRRPTHIDGPAIVLQIVQAVGHGTSKGITGKIMDVDSLWLLTPDLTWVLEVAHEFLFLGVYTNHWLSLSLMLSPLSLNVLKLLIPIRMLSTCLLFGVGLQGVAILLQQAADHRPAYTVALDIQTLSNVHQSAIEPLAIAHRIARCVRLYNVQQYRF